MILPTRDEQDSIAACLESLAAQDYEGPMEIIIAEAEEPEAIARIAHSVHLGMHVIRNSLKLTPYGIRAALAVAKGEYIVRCDGHNTLPPHYISTAVDTLKRTGAANVGGLLLAKGETFVQRAIAMAMNSRAGVGYVAHRTGKTEGPASTAQLGVFKRADLDSIGGYGHRYIRADDYEMNYRFRRNGMLIWYDPELVVDYTPRSNMRSLALQYLRYGRSKARLALDHPRTLTLRHLPPALFVILLAVGIVLAFLGRPEPLISLAIPYGGFLLGTAAYKLIRHRDPAALLLLLVLPAMHIPWGIGFLAPARPLPVEPDDPTGLHGSEITEADYEP